MCFLIFAHFALTLLRLLWRGLLHWCCAELLRLCCAGPAVLCCAAIPHALLMAATALHCSTMVPRAVMAATTRQAVTRCSFEALRSAVDQ